MYRLYKEEWHRLKKARLNQRSMERLINAIADSFLDKYYRDLTYDGNFIEQLPKICSDWKSKKAIH